MIGRAARGDRGSAIVEVTWLGVLLLVPLVYLVIAVLDVQRAAYATSAAARSAAQAFSQAPSPAVARDRARVAYAMTLKDHGIAPQRADLVIRCGSGPCLSPGSTVVVSVRARVPLPLVPDVLGGDHAGVRVSAAHTERYGRFREDRSTAARS